MKEHSLIEFEKKIFFSYARYPASEIQHLGWKLQTISVRLDFLKCVQIFIFFKTQFCTECVSNFSRHQRKSVE